MDKPLAIILALFTFLLGMLVSFKMAYFLPYNRSLPSVQAMEQAKDACEKSLPRDKECEIVITARVKD